MKKIKAIGIKEEGKPYRMKNSDAFKEMLNNLLPGEYEHIVDKLRRKATPKQFGYLYGLVYPMSWACLTEAGYEFTTIDQVDDFWKAQFAFKNVLNRENGEIYKLPMTKTEFMTIDEMTYTDAIRNYCLEYFNAAIPDPDPDYKKKRDANKTRE